MASCLKILMCTTHLNPGGITSYIYNLSSELIQRGHKICVVSSGGSMQESFQAIGAKTININIRTKSELSPKIWFNLARMVKLIKEENIDLIHAHTRVTQVLSQVISNRAQKAYVSTCHGFFKPRWFRRKFGCWGDKVIAISDAVKQHLIQDLKVAPEKIELVYSGINLKRYPLVTEKEKEMTKQALGLENKPTIGIIARLSDVKGHEYLIHAFKKVIEKKPDAQLLIIGDGPRQNDLIKLVKELNLEKRVYFRPSVFDTNQVLKAFDIFCMPSLNEGLGLAVAEAQAAGIPVIASKVGGLLSLVKDEHTGLLVEPKNPLQLSEAIFRILNNQELSRNIAQNARKFIEEKFSLDKMASEIEDIYRKVL